MFNLSKTNWTFNLTAAIDSQHFPDAKNEKKIWGVPGSFLRYRPSKKFAYFHRKQKISALKSTLNLCKLIPHKKHNLRQQSMPVSIG